MTREELDQRIEAIYLASDLPGVMSGMNVDGSDKTLDELIEDLAHWDEGMWRNWDRCPGLERLKPLIKIHRLAQLRTIWDTEGPEAAMLWKLSLP